MAIEAVPRRKKKIKLSCVQNEASGEMLLLLTCCCLRHDFVTSYGMRTGELERWCVVGADIVREGSL